MTKKADPGRDKTLHKREKVIHDSIPLLPDQTKEGAKRRERVRTLDKKIRNEFSRRNRQR
jgi:hypothetical protein